MSLGLCCAGVDLGGGGRRRGEGQDEVVSTQSYLLNILFSSL
jgi:hypothetical protein